MCNCCPKCARLEGESCGGLWEMYGQCAKGLECQKKERKIGENKELSRAYGMGTCGKWWILHNNDVIDVSLA